MKDLELLAESNALSAAIDTAGASVVGMRLAGAPFAGGFHGSNFTPNVRPLPHARNTAIRGVFEDSLHNKCPLGFARDGACNLKVLEQIIGYFNIDMRHGAKLAH